MTTNFIFVRHGQSCNNAQKALVKTTIFNEKLLKNILNLEDPHLSELGVNVSIKNGKVIENIITNIYKFNKELKINNIDIVGCSPLIRSMETAYYMTRKWKNPPKKIIVFPLLRELDENSVDPYNYRSEMILQKIPGYYMSNIKKQKKYLKDLGILEFFDFSVLQNNYNLRKKPGNIKLFIEWFNKRFGNTKKSNVFIVTHSGVLHEFTKERFENNSGFILNVSLDRDIRYNILQSMTNHLPNNFFKNYTNSIYNLDYYCPSQRCGDLCKLLYV